MNNIVTFKYGNEAITINSDTIFSIERYDNTNIIIYATENKDKYPSHYIFHLKSPEETNKYFNKFSKLWKNNSNTNLNHIYI